MTATMSVESAAAISQGLRDAHWSAADLWFAALGVGAGLSPTDIERISDGRRDATPLEHDVLASALNDHFLDHGGERPVHYWRELQASTAVPGN